MRKNLQYLRLKIFNPSELQCGVDLFKAFKSAKRYYEMQCIAAEVMAEGASPEDIQSMQPPVKNY